MIKVRINDLARELEVKSRPILDALEAIGVSGKTHSSSIDEDQAQRVRDYFKNGGSGSRSSSRPAPEQRPSFNLSGISKPGDAMRAILERKQAEATGVRAVPPPARPQAPVVQAAAPTSRPSVAASAAVPVPVAAPPAPAVRPSAPTPPAAPPPRRIVPRLDRGRKSSRRLPRPPSPAARRWAQ